jgi:hypothetical protein
MNRWRTLMLAGLLAGAAMPPAAARPDLADDPRLARPVTLRMVRRPLSAVAAELGRQAEVTLRTSAEVADEPAILVATDQPAREVMRQIALLFNYRWARKGEPGHCAYELYQDLASKGEEAALRRQRHARAVAGLQAALRQRGELARRHGDNPQMGDRLDREAALPERPTDRYTLHEMRDPFRRALLDVTERLTPAQWQFLLTGETLSFSTRAEAGSLPLPPTIAGALRQARPWRLPPGLPAPSVEPEKEASHREAEQEEKAKWAQAQGVRIELRLALPSGRDRSQAVLTVRPTALMPDNYRDPECAGADAPLLPILVVAGQDDPAASGPTAAAGRSGRTPGDDPLLGRKRRFQVTRDPRSTREPTGEGAPAADGASAGEAGSLHHLLASIAAAYGVNLVADGYRSGAEPLPSLPAGEEWPLYQLMDRFVLPSARWSRVGAFLQVRRHTWYEERLAEIPERIVRSWSERLQRARTLSLEETAALVRTLSDAQLGQFEAVMQEAGLRVHLMFTQGDDPESRRERAMLRAYGSMLPGQRRRLQEGGWIPSAAMPPEAREWLSIALGARSSAEISVRSLPTAVIFQYRSPGSDTEAIRVSLPRVEECDRRE